METTEDNYSRAYNRGRNFGYQEGLRDGEAKANAWPKFISGALHAAVNVACVLALGWFVYTQGQLHGMLQLAAEKVKEREQKTAVLDVRPQLPGTVIIEKGNSQTEVRVK